MVDNPHKLMQLVADALREEMDAYYGTGRHHDCVRLARAVLGAMDAYAAEPDVPSETKTE